MWSALMLKNPPTTTRNIMRQGFSPWLGKIPWRRIWQPTPVFFPGESMNRGAWRARVHRVSKSHTWLNQLSMHAHIQTYVSLSNVKDVFVWRNYENFTFLRNYSYDQYIKSFHNPFYIFIIIHLKINQILFHQSILIK